MNRVAVRFVRLVCLVGLALFNVSGRATSFVAPIQGGEPANLAELVELAPENWAEYAPLVKEVDAIYGENGKFRQEIALGKYDVVISLGPEYDAVFAPIEVEAGKDALLNAQLRRTVDTRGWISADYHNHSSPSGDNVSSQLGRVLNLLGEHIEFAPCTEHNRIDSYQPHLERLRAAALMATCTGMELTGGLLPVNHQNAFRLKHRPRTQDGGGPRIDVMEMVRASERGNLVMSNGPFLEVTAAAGTGTTANGRGEAPRAFPGDDLGAPLPGRIEAGVEAQPTAK